jgi:hypothetical protein
MNDGEIRLRAVFGESSARGEGGERQKNLREVGKEAGSSFYCPNGTLNNKTEGLE